MYFFDKAPNIFLQKNSGSSKKMNGHLAVQVVVKVFADDHINVKYF